MGGTSFLAEIIEIHLKFGKIIYYNYVIFKYLNFHSESPTKQKNEAELLRQEADMPIEELMAQYDRPPELKSFSSELKNLRKKKQIQSPIICSKRPMFGQGDADDEVKDTIPPDGSVIPLRATADIQEKLANGHAENENNLNREKEQSEILQKAQGSSSSVSCDIRKMECDSAIKTDEESLPTSTEKVESSEACSSSVLLSSSSSSCSGGQSVQNASVSSSDSNQEAQARKGDQGESNEADSTSSYTGASKGSAGGSCSQKSEADEGPSSMDESTTGGSSSHGQKSEPDDCLSSTRVEECTAVGSDGVEETGQSGSSNGISGGSSQVMYHSKGE